MVGFIERLLNLRRGDFDRGFLLFLYLFFVLTSYMVGKVARDALFLDKFKATQLPYADLAAAAMVGVAVALYVRIGRRLTLRVLLIGSLLFFSSNAILFWFFARFHRFEWLYPLVYVWVSIFGVLAPAQVWTLANYVLTTREAKRVFGLVGSGAIAGAIFGGFFSKSVSEISITEDLLLGMGVFLIACAFLVFLIYRREQAASVPDEEGAGVDMEQGLGVAESFKLLFSSRYLIAIGAVITISSFATTFAGWQFKAIAKQTFQGKEALAAFFGGFQFYTGALALGTQLLLTSRVLRRFGLGPALFVVPAALLMGTVGLLILPIVWTAALLKGSDQVLRYSIDKSAVELLYLPVPPNIKVQVKSFIDTFIWRMGDGFAAIAVLIFATYLGFSPRMVSWVNLVMISGWVGIAWYARRQYVLTLKESIQQHRLDAERQSAPTLDRSTAQVLSENICEVDPEEILYGLSLFEIENRPAVHPVIRDLLGHPDPRIRVKALSLLDSAGDRNVLSRAEEMLRDPDFNVRTEALLYLAHHTNIDPLTRIEELGDFPDFSIRAAMVSFLARPGRSQNLEAARHILDTMVSEAGPEGAIARMEAARLIGALPPEFDKQLRRLIRDDNPEVAREAIFSAGRLKRRTLLPDLLDRLGDAELQEDAAETLSRFGDRIVGTLRDHLADPEVPMSIRRALPQLLRLVGAEPAEKALTENLLESDTALRFAIISALNKLVQQHPNLKPDPQMVETVMAAEILGHYRSYQIAGTLGPEFQSEHPVARGLRESMEQEKERIFRLLGLLHPDLDLHSAYVGVQSKDSLVHANALEFLDNVLKKNLRDVLVPLLDSDVDLQERVRLANRITGAGLGDQQEAVATLLQNEDPWLKSCGAYAVGALKLTSLAGALEECLRHPDPLLRETARLAKARLSGAPLETQTEPAWP